MKQGISMRAASVLLTMLALTGCWGPEVHRPTTPAGAICAEQCDQQRFSCNNSAEAIAGSQNSCESQQQHVAERCSPWVKDEDKKRCQIVNNPGGGACVASTPDYGACTDTWRRCIVSCGGYVE